MVNRTSTLVVWMNGLKVGELTKSSTGALAFAYISGWLETGGARPISLSMPLLMRCPCFYFFDLFQNKIELSQRIVA